MKNIQPKKDLVYKIPDSVTAIDNIAFAYNKLIKRIKISKNLTSIGEGAFCGCLRLKSINLKRDTPIRGLYDYNDGVTTYWTHDSDYDGDYPDEFYNLGTFSFVII